MSASRHHVARLAGDPRGPPPDRGKLLIIPRPQITCETESPCLTLAARRTKMMSNTLMVLPALRAAAHQHVRLASRA